APLAVAAAASLVPAAAFTTAPFAAATLLTAPAGARRREAALAAITAAASLTLEGTRLPLRLALGLPRPLPLEPRAVLLRLLAGLFGLLPGGALLGRLLL